MPHALGVHVALRALVHGQDARTRNTLRRSLFLLLGLLECPCCTRFRRALEEQVHTAEYHRRENRTEANERNKPFDGLLWRKQ